MGNFMGNSSLDETLTAKKLEKNFPQTLRIDAEELLQRYGTNAHEFDDILNKTKNEKKTSNVWVDYLRRPVWIDW